MSYVTLSGRLSTDLLFDPRALRPGYHDWHSIHTDVEDREPMIGLALNVSYRVYHSYTDAGDRRIDRIELLAHQSSGELRRGVEARSYALRSAKAAEAALLVVLSVDAGSALVARQIADEVERHQADRDDDYAAESRP